MNGTQNFRGTYAEISLKNLENNFRILKNLIKPGEFFCPMVKANAYGHGDIETASALISFGARHLGVALVEEGLRLRQSGIDTEILLFGPCETTQSAAAVVKAKLVPVIGEWASLEKLADQVKQQNIDGFSVHLEFNTGMNRLGFNLSDAPRLEAKFNKSPLRIAGVCTHMLRGDDTANAHGNSARQLKNFADIQNVFVSVKPQWHVLNSSAAASMTLDKKSLNFGLRPGIALYGGEPLATSTGLALRPVMSLRTHVVLWHRLNAGETVSYNATWTAKRPSLIGVLPIGYADGYGRGLGNCASVLCRGERAPVVGTVCMDYIMIDCTDIENRLGSLQPDEDIVLFGTQGSGQIKAEELAQHLNTISYEIFTRVSSRVPRVYKDRE